MWYKLNGINAQIGAFIGAGAAHESLHETPDRNARPRHTSHLRVHLGRAQKAREEALRAARPPQQLYWQHRGHVLRANQPRDLLALPHSEITVQLKLNYFIQCAHTEMHKLDKIF